MKTNTRINVSTIIIFSVLCGTLIFCLGKLAWLANIPLYIFFGMIFMYGGGIVAVLCILSNWMYGLSWKGNPLKIKEILWEK